MELKNCILGLNAKLNPFGYVFDVVKADTIDLNPGEHVEIKFELSLPPVTFC